MPILNEDDAYVYLLEEIQNIPTGMVKIGRTTNTAEVRAQQLNTGNPRMLKTYAVLKTTAAQSAEKETQLLDYFNTFRATWMGGKEWFDDNSGAIKDFFNNRIDKLGQDKFDPIAFWLDNLISFANGPFKDTFDFVEKIYCQI